MLVLVLLLHVVNVALEGNIQIYGLQIELLQLGNRLLLSLGEPGILYAHFM